MKLKVGVMGSAADTLSDEAAAMLRAKTETLGRAIAAHALVLLTGATTGTPFNKPKTTVDAPSIEVAVAIPVKPAVSLKFESN